jgi:hypothetical protein
VLKLPSWATTALACIAGLAAVLNQTTFDLVAPWKSVLAIAIVFVAGLGIGPLTGAAFRNALHIPQNVNIIISAAIGAASIAVTTLSMSTAAHATILAALTILAGLGFGTIPTPAQLARETRA